VYFKSRLFTGVSDSKKEMKPDMLVLDGQQRFTSIYTSMFCRDAVPTRTDKNQDWVYHEVVESLGAGVWYGQLNGVFNHLFNSHLYTISLYPLAASRNFIYFTAFKSKKWKLIALKTIF